MRISVYGNGFGKYASTVYQILVSWRTELPQSREVDIFFEIHSASTAKTGDSLSLVFLIFLANYSPF